MHLYYDHTLYSFPLCTFLLPEDGLQRPKHVVVSTINKIQDSCVVTYRTLSPITRHAHLADFVFITVIKLAKNTSHEAPRTQSSPLSCHFLPLKSKNSLIQGNFPHFVKNEIPYCRHKSPPLVFIVNQNHPFQALLFYTFQICFSIVLPFMLTPSKLSVYVRYPNQTGKKL